MIRRRRRRRRRRKDISCDQRALVLGMLLPKLILKWKNLQRKRREGKKEI